MFESIQAFVPAEWQGAFQLLTAPLAWLPDWHTGLVNFAWYGGSLGEMLFKRMFLLLPVFVLLVAVWTTMVSLYTLPFRSGRAGFMNATLMSYWDSARSVWLFWAGFLRLGVVFVGWTWGALRVGLGLVFTVIKGAVASPMMLLDWTTRSYFKPGMPWIAFLALLVWSAVEATIFMYTLSPTMTEVLAGITGYEPNPYLMAPLLWMFLFFLVLGSFACIQVLTEAIRAKRISEIVQMLFVEFFVMFFEVIFLYRELIDAVTPWIAQTTSQGVQLGLWSTLALASFGWIGVRGMTWFLFGRFGTPAVLAILARDGMHEGSAPIVRMAPQPNLLQAPIQALKAETVWFRNEAHQVFEMVTLPVLQLLAAAANSIVVVISAKPIFKLPFESLDEALAATPLWPKARNGKKASPASAPATSTPLVEGGAR